MTWCNYKLLQIEDKFNFKDPRSRCKSFFLQLLRILSLSQPLTYKMNYSGNVNFIQLSEKLPFYCLYIGPKLKTLFWLRNFKSTWFMVLLFCVVCMNILEFTSWPFSITICNYVWHIFKVITGRKMCNLSYSSNKKQLTMKKMCIIARKHWDKELDSLQCNCFLFK